MQETKVWTKEEIREMLKTNDRAVERGILALYNRQTSDEQSVEVTRYRNNIGFNQPDSYILTSFAKQLLGRRKDIGLSDKQMWVARRKMLKYAGQLASIANS